MRNKVKQVIWDSYRIGYKDLLELFREKMRLITFIIMPIFMMLMMGYIFPEEDILNNIPLGIINEDQGEYGSMLLEQLEEAGLPEEQKAFILNPVDSIEEAKEKIQTQDLNGTIVIPADFSEHILNGQQETVTIITDQSNPQVSTLLTRRLEHTMEAFSTQLGTEKLTQQGLVSSVEDAQAFTEPVVVTSEGVVPGKTNYFQFMAPGVMTMVMVTTVMMGLAGTITKEKVNGTLDGMLVAPVSRLSIILGKTFSQTTRGLLEGAIVLALAILLFGVVIQGSILLMISLLTLGIFSFIGLGVLISSIATEQETANAIMMTVYFPMFFLCGAFFPIQQMPSWLQGVSHVIPLTYAIEALRKVILLGADLPSVTTEIIILAAFGLVTLAIAIPIFNRITTR